MLFGLPAYLALVALETAIVVLAIHGGITASRNLPRSIAFAAFPTAFVAGEYFRAQLPALGFTWGGLGYALHDDLGALRLAAFTGVWGLSLAVALCNALLAEGIARVRQSKAKSAMLWVGAALSVALPRILPPGLADGPEATIAMVQGNLPDNPGDPGSDDLTVLTNHVELTARLKPGSADLVVWPESALDEDPADRQDFQLLIDEAIARARAPLLLGTAIDVEKERFRNVSLFYDEAGHRVGEYSKIHLVPFGEYVPLRRILAPLIPQLEQVPRDGIPGSSFTLFEIGAGKFASVICFESTFPSLVRRFVDEGARLLVVSTNNSSFRRTSASEQHVAFSQLRAAEHRMWVVHAALTGISAVITPEGAVVDRTELFEPALLSPKVRFARETTLFARLGDWVPALLFIALLLAWVLPLLRLFTLRR